MQAGIIVLIRRKTRAAERAALIRLLDKAGETGIRKNINFAWRSESPSLLLIGRGSGAVG